MWNVHLQGFLILSARIYNIIVWMLVYEYYVCIWRCVQIFHGTINFEKNKHSSFILLARSSLLKLLFLFTTTFRTAYRIHSCLPASFHHANRVYLEMNFFCCTFWHFWVASVSDKTANKLFKKLDLFPGIVGNDKNKRI